MEKIRFRFKFATAALSAILAAFVFAGCANKDGSTVTTQPDNQASESSPSQNEVLPPDNISEGENDITSFKPSELGMPAQERYEFPYMGMNMVLTETLLSNMDSRDVVMMTDEDYTADGSIKYAALFWYSLTEEQKNEEVTSLEPDAWKAGLKKIGALGIYHTDSTDKLDTLTGCTQHTELGKSADGNYVYYLSFADEADVKLKEELEKTEVTLTDIYEMEPSAEQNAFSDKHIDTAGIGDFKTTDINGNEYTQEVFKDYELTLVNIFTTWCSPCINEMPELEKLKNEMSAKGVNVIGIVYDSVTDSGNVNQDAIDTAKLLQEKAELTFPLLIPDEEKMNGRLQGINGFPESFFVDKDGNIVGETYMGARTFDDWKTIIEAELESLQGAGE